jgi:ADP-ribose pyrophosphatase YjhB (NUDIX family)
MILDQSYLESLPRKRMGAGCLIFDEQGRLLLVKPRYKPVWEIPGGVVEHNESPQQCCQREVKEEIGLERKISRLLVVDYNSQTEAKTESLMFIFDGGSLSQPEIDSIRLHPTEITCYNFFTLETLPTDMTSSLRNRVLAAWQQISKSSAVYLENQLIA